MKKDPRGRERVTKKGKYGCLLAQIGREGRPFVLRRKEKLRIRESGELHVFVNAVEPPAPKGGFRLELTVEK